MTAIAISWRTTVEAARTRLARNTLWATAGSAVSQGSSLLAAFVLGRMLGVAEFGQFALIQTTVIVLGNLGEAGLALTTTKYVSRWRAQDPVRTGCFIGWSLAATACLAAAMVAAMSAMVALPAWPAGVTLSTGFRAGAGLLVFDMLNRVQLGALAGLEAFSTSARIHLMRGLLLLPGVYLGARLGGLLGAIAAMSLVSFAVFVSGQWFLRQRCASDSIRIQCRHLQQPWHVLRTSAFLWIGALLLSGSAWAVTILLARQPAGLLELGLYYAGDRWRTALLFVPQVLFQVVLPMLSHHQAIGDQRSSERVASAALAATVAVTGSAALLVSLLSKPLMLIFGEDFAGGADVLALAAAGTVAGGVYTVGSSVLWALGKPSHMLGIDIFRTALFLVLCLGGMASSASNAMLAYLLSFSAAGAIVLVKVRGQLCSRSESLERKTW